MGARIASMGVVLRFRAQIQARRKTDGDPPSAMAVDPAPGQLQRETRVANSHWQTDDGYRRGHHSARCRHPLLRPSPQGHNPRCQARVGVVTARMGGGQGVRPLIADLQTRFFACIRFVVVTCAGTDNCHKILGRMTCFDDHRIRLRGMRSRPFKQTSVRDSRGQREDPHKQDHTCGGALGSGFSEECHIGSVLLALHGGAAPW